MQKYLITFNLYYQF